MGTREQVDVHGATAAGWEGVREAFATNFDDGGEVGAAVCVYHRGQQVVHLWAGHTDNGMAAAYTPDTLQLVFSTTKGVIAIAVAMCVERGLLDYDEHVATYWPEFAEHDKGEATVAQLLSHQCGLISVDGDIGLDEALDWATVTSRLAQVKPDWPIGATHGYHALTYGWLAGELIRRTDGRTPGQFVADEIAGPLGVEIYIGLPDEHQSRVAPLLGQPLGTDAADPAIKAMLEQFLGPDTRAGRALTLNGAFSGEGTFNRPDVRAAEIPAANGVTTAAALAKMYAATMQSVDGIQLLGDEVRERARTTVTPPGEPDACLIMPTTFGMGFMTHGPFTPYSGPGAFGHPGAGGSVAFAHPELQLSFGYTMNQMAQNLAADPRAQRLTAAAAAAASS
jgi:CubicO group peptidase (beta-lactamase class C family)